MPEKCEFLIFYISLFFNNYFYSLKIYHDLCTTGLLNTTINQWVTLSFCLPQKAHQFHKKGVVVEPEAIDRCLQSLKPYHGMLLLVDLTELLDCVPPSGARMLLQLINAYNPLKTLQNMASEADLAIKHVRLDGGILSFLKILKIILTFCLGLRARRSPRLLGQGHNHLSAVRDQRLRNRPRCPVTLPFATGR